MGRKKGYDRDELVRQSMELFRDHGYAGTSTQMLVEELRINRFSLYAEFGDKQSLFDAALDRYFRTVIEPRFLPLEEPEAGLDEIRAVLQFYGSAGEGSALGRGCLLCNTAVELGAHDPSGAGFVQRYFERLSSGFRTALANAHNRGDLAESVDPREQAEYLTASVLGVFVMLRAGAAPSAIASAAEGAIRHLDQLSR